jgi:cysteinyl-tRNA synthetase
MIESTHLTKIDAYRQQFLAHVYHDLDLPAALTVIGAVIKSNLFNEDKYDLIIEFDEILGLGLRQAATLYLREQAAIRASTTHDPQLTRLLAARQAAKKSQDFPTADRLRGELLALGYEVIDTPDGHAHLQPLSQPS